jgi:hypothetical protein
VPFLEDLIFTDAPGTGTPVFESVIFPVTSVWAKMKEENKSKPANKSHFLMSFVFWCEKTE